MVSLEGVDVVRQAVGDIAVAFEGEVEAFAGEVVVVTIPITEEVSA